MGEEPLQKANIDSLKSFDQQEEGRKNKSEAIQEMIKRITRDIKAIILIAANTERRS